MKTHAITICAFMVALLIAVQFALSFVAGVELVTVLFVTFCCVFGVRYALITANAFCMVRCLIFGFYPSVAVLYIVYYNLVAVLFGLMGRRARILSRLALVWLIAVAVACACFAVTGVPIGEEYQTRITALLWVLFALCAALIAAHAVFALSAKGKAAKEIAAVTSLAVVCTVLFTLLDDVITPLFYGLGADIAVGYFYTSLLTLLPQTIEVAVSVFVLYLPLKKAMLMFRRDEDRKKLIVAGTEKV